MKKLWKPIRYTALCVVIAVGGASCSNPFFARLKKNAAVNDGAAVVETYTVRFSSDANTGTLTARVDGNDIVSGAKLAKGTTVVFIAKPHSVYIVTKWSGLHVDDGSVRATLVVNSDVDVSVQFQSIINSPQAELSDTLHKIPVPDGGMRFPIGEKDYVPSPWHTVEATYVDAPYFIAETEVRYALWYTIVKWAEQNGYRFQNQGREGSDGIDGALPTDGNNEPVTMISFRDCAVWCNAATEWYNAQTGSALIQVYEYDLVVVKDATSANVDKVIPRDKATGFRLPTNHEWELAARLRNNDVNTVKEQSITLGASLWYFTKGISASGAEYNVPAKDQSYYGQDPIITLPAGKTWDELRDNTAQYAVYDKWWNGKNWIKQNPPVTKTASVKSKLPNSLGLYDMSGNAAEWCVTRWSPHGTDHHIAGGSYCDWAFSMQIGHFSMMSAHVPQNWIGFRLARTRE